MRSIESETDNVSTRCDTSTCIQVDVYEGEHLTEPVVRVHSTETGTVMQGRYSEWIKFVTEVKNGDWDHVVTDMEFALARRAAKDMKFVEDDQVVSYAEPLWNVEAKPFDINDVVDAAEHKAR
jgi:hypothetical protein